jgi:AraC-like DNA-binding protein
MKRVSRNAEVQRCDCHEMGNNTEGRAFQEQFFARHPGLRSMMDLFEHAAGVYFYAKDRNSRFVRLNRANVSLYGLVDETPLLGKTDRQFHPPALANAYVAEDQRVMSSRESVVGQVWLVPFLDGPMQWFISSKIPLIGAGDEVIGLAGIMHPIATPEHQHHRFLALAPAMQYLEKHFAEPLRMGDLAEMCRLSPTDFGRLFQKLLRTSPSEYVTSLRLQEARRLLTSTNRTLSSIALETGFCDQSHFTKRFRQLTGMTPTQYRKSSR